MKPTRCAPVSAARILPAAALLALAGSRAAQAPAEAHLYTRAEAGSVRAALEIELADGWHLYHEELGHPEAIGLPTTLAFGGDGVEWSDLDWPAPERIGQGFPDSKGQELWILGHEGTVRVYAFGTLEAGASGAGIEVSIEGQVCKESCIPFFETVASEGPGPDALFAAFPVALLPDELRKTAEKPAPDGATGAGASAAPDGEDPDERKSGRADATLYTRTEGRTVRAAIELAIEPGWHLYDLDPGDTRYADPLRVTLGGEGITWGEVRAPSPRRYDQAVDDAWAWGHESTIVLHADGELAEGATGDDASADLEGQTCSESLGGVCEPYRETAYTRGRGSDALFAPQKESARSPSGAAGTEAETGLGGADLARFLLLAFLGGLFALVMPCTYPMIPITISFFTKQADARGGNALPLSLAYGAGIIGIFVVIGVVFGSLIIPFATHPITNVVIGLAFLYFAFVLFGVVDLQPPRFLMNAAGQASKKGGYLGVFLMGATLVVTSFTCTAPFVGSLLSVGASDGNVGRVALGMAVFGLTMALPFVLLSLVPGRIRAMPRGGEWMNTFKHFLGFVEIAAALKFLSNSDIVWDLQILSRELFLLLWGLLFIAAGLYLLGVFQRGSKPSATRRVGGVATLAFALYCFRGMTGVPMDQVMTAIAPNYSGGRLMPALYDPRASWALVKDDYDHALDTAREEGKLVFVNFTGFTCVNCRVNEERVFPAPESKAVLDLHFVEARLHTDHNDAAIRERNRKLQEELAHSVATPFYLVVDPRTDRRVGGTLAGVTTPPALRSFLLEAVEASKDRVGRGY